MPLVPPAGISPASAYLYIPIAQPESPPVIQADKIGGDENGRDFLSLTQSADPVDDAVRVVWATERASGAAVRDVGHRLRLLRHTDELTEESARGIVDDAMKRMVDAGFVRITGVTVQVGSDGERSASEDTGLVDVEFENRVTRQKFTRTFKRA